MFGDSIAWLVFAGVLLSSFTGILWENIAKNQLSDTYRGALAENYVAQTLKASGYELYYWTYDSPAAEFDFLIQKNGEIVPIEVESGKNVSAKSLKHFQKLHEPKKVFRLSEKNFGTDGNVFAIPLYAVFCI